VLQRLPRAVASRRSDKRAIANDAQFISPGSTHFPNNSLATQLKTAKLYSNWFEAVKSGGLCRPTSGRPSVRWDLVFRLEVLE
jgi:hypothetical protein